MRGPPHHRTYLAQKIEVRQEAEEKWRNQWLNEKERKERREWLWEKKGEDTDEEIVAGDGVCSDGSPAYTVNT